MQFRAKLVSWEEITDWCLILRHKIIESYSPDMIIGLSRGGLVPARMLSDYLWIKDLYAVKTEHWGITASKDGEARLQTPTNLPIRDRSVLVIDDITDTGGSMKLASDFIKAQGPADLRTATMLHIDHSKFVPDFVASEISGKQWTWFIFPWNVYEDLLNLIGKSVSGYSTAEEISETLREDFELAVPEDTLSQVLENFTASNRLDHSGGKWKPPGL